MISDTVLGVIVVFAIACGVYSAVVANQKGYDRAGWFMAGLFFNLVGLIAAAGLPTKPVKPAAPAQATK